MTNDVPRQQRMMTLSGGDASPTTTEASTAALSLANEERMVKLLQEAAEKQCDYLEDRDSRKGRRDAARASLDLYQFQAALGISAIERDTLWLIALQGERQKRGLAR